MTKNDNKAERKLLDDYLKKQGISYEDYLKKLKEDEKKLQKYKDFIEFDIAELKLILKYGGKKHES